jgi:hypothetical protein
MLQDIEFKMIDVREREAHTYKFWEIPKEVTLECL